MSEPLRVLIAGAGGGIGAACHDLLLATGARTHGVDRPGCDITLPGGAEQAVSEASAALGGLDGIVHAVGMSGRRLGDGPVTTLADEAWSELLRVNLESVFRLLRAGLPALRETGAGSTSFSRWGPRMLSAETVAQAVGWLLSPAASATTGVALPVDAGWTLR